MLPKLEVLNAERIDQLAEGIKVLKLMWTEDEPSWQGRYFKIAKAYSRKR